MIGMTPQAYRDQYLNQNSKSGVGSAIGSTIGSTITAFTGVPALGAIGGLLGGAAGYAFSDKGKLAGEADEQYGRLLNTDYQKRLTDFNQNQKSAQDGAYQQRMQSMRRNVIPNSIDYLKFL